MMCLRRYILAMIYGLSLLMQPMFMLASTSANAGTTTSIETSSAQTAQQHSHANHQHSAAKRDAMHSMSCCNHVANHESSSVSNTSSSQSTTAAKTAHDCCSEHAKHSATHNAKHSDTAHQKQCQDHSCCAHSCCSGNSCPTTSSTKSLIAKPANKFHPVNRVLPNKPIENLKRPPKTTP